MAATLLAALAVAGGDAAAQEPGAASRVVAASMPSRAEAPSPPSLVESAAGQVAVAALVPGVGQALAGRPWTGLLFAAVEGAGWWIHLDARGDRNEFRDAYRDLAWAVARDRPQPRVDGPFEYYERLIHWTRSGAWDRDPSTPGVQPEHDVSTWNGRQWRLAADIFLGGDTEAPPTTPGYASALDYYRARAYEPALLWDWSGHDDDRARYAGLIDRADAASRRASIALGAVVANHVLSAVEAFVATRLGARDFALDVVPGPTGGVGGRGGATFRVRFLHSP